jgi:hypothetical protein
VVAPLVDDDRRAPAIEQAELPRVGLDGGGIGVASNGAGGDEDAAEGGCAEWFSVR